MAEWLAAAPADGPVTAWLSLDPGDNDPATFWTHLIAALQVVVPGVGARTRSLLEPPGTALEVALAPLLNELEALPNDVVLVLDDYHAIDAPEIQAGMSFLLEHLPANGHLVIVTRADPSLPMARLRARGELVEIRAADLRFTQGEAEAYLNGVMTLGLTEQDVAVLDARTEGWIAALQLAGLSMQGRDDVAGFIAAFAGDDRYIVDYLVEEVWQRQPDDVRDFLVRTSILSRMSGPLCDAVTGNHDGKTTLEALDRRNLFLIALDDRRRWYRYHHLFADVLQARLLDESPELVAELHRRAAEWFAAEGEYAEAIRHAMATPDFARAADLVELAIPATGRARQDSTLRRWLEALPDDQIRVRPVLSNAYAGTRLVRGELDGVEERLLDAERWLATSTGDGEASPSSSGAMVITDTAAFRDLPAGIAIHRAGQARILGDEAGTMAHAQRALDLARDDDHFVRGAAAALLALAYWTRADLDEASRLHVDAIASFEQIGHVADVLGISIALADIRLAQGRLSDAQRTYERGLELAAAQALPSVRGVADMHVGISEVACERGDLATARSHLEVSEALGDHAGLAQNPYRSRVATARVRGAEGDLDAAIELLDQAERVFVSDYSPEVRPIPAMRARVWITQGRLDDAARWAREHGLSATDDATYIREFEHATLARLLVAQGTHDHVVDPIRASGELLERLLLAAGAGGRTASVIDILATRALAHHALGEDADAMAALDRALALAAPEGYTRIFLDQGPPMAALLKQAAKQRPSWRQVRRLLAANVVPERATPVEQPLIEPLSERELEVLRLLESDLDGPDIARTLTVSLPTVRTHTRNIYGKLGVSSRRAAVRRAAELGLLGRTRDRRPT